MVAADEVQIDKSGPYWHYSLTQAGYRRGRAALASFPAPVADYVGRAARWVRLMPYRMLAAIYLEYPEMAKNSVVRHLAAERSAPKGSPFIRGMTRALDLVGTMYRAADSEVGLQSDADALDGIWRAVGDDIEEAMVQFGESECAW